MAPARTSSLVSSDQEAFELPRLRVSFGLESDARYLGAQEDAVPEFFDIKFCPDQPLSQDPVFAAVSKKQVVICKLSRVKDDTNPCETITIIRDTDDDAENCCCTWSRDLETGRPLICVAGKDSKIKVYDVITGEVAACLVGHGGEINDLATSPSDPSIIASASDDTTVRVWGLGAVHAKQPCLCLLGGESHRAALLSVSFHATGRYLLSAGHDGVINMWTLPDLPREPLFRPYELYYPHFATSEIHNTLVDCVAFYGDRILSRACHNEVIVLWSIEGFSSSDPPPPQSAAPTPYDPSRLTRSAFSPSMAPAGPVLYNRILELDTPGCGVQFFMRFQLHHVPGQHPVLAFCNANGRVFFWDFERIREYRDFVRAVEDSQKVGDPAPPRSSWLQLAHPRKGGPAEPSGKARASKEARPSADSTVPERSSEAGDRSDGPLKAYTQETVSGWESKYVVGSARQPLKAHKVEAFGTSNFVGRQVGWSPGGEWCVVVGSSNVALMLQRWAKK
ncbi:related to `extra sex combs` protein (WD-40 repeat family protein) [Cephalotrichum gorgonifer]|uniref:Related to `extra sex combs` protein (WD-40 repeat family protein) n=1 Tax=Cephalotrichum gorgonifer TaxID=2041049 RepID=A0AAE8SYJ0_9PEZI|nr:related to `extra sex combs` protein (WD-40 repeat family protein) [Cephalotrichum gorgonifer]